MKILNKKPLYKLIKHLVYSCNIHLNAVILVHLCRYNQQTFDINYFII